MQRDVYKRQVYDSRKVVKGCAFICLKGATVDGHTFAQQAVEQGAAVLIVQNDVTVTYEIPVIKVSHTRQALAMMSLSLIHIWIINSDI